MEKRNEKPPVKMTKNQLLREVWELSDLNELQLQKIGELNTLVEDLKSNTAIREHDFRLWKDMYFTLADSKRLVEKELKDMRVLKEHYEEKYENTVEPDLPF